MTQNHNVSVSMNQAAVVKTGMVFKQGDFGFNLVITVLDFDVTGTTPQIVFRKPMGAVESTTITVSGNTYTYAMKGTELDTPGKVFCDLKLKNSTTQRISSASFMFEVVADTMDGLAEQASSYSDTIEQLIGTALKAQPVNSSYTDLNQFVDTGIYSLPIDKVYANDPVGNTARKVLITLVYPDKYPSLQILIKGTTGSVYCRHYTSGVWGSWASEGATLQDMIKMQKGDSNAKYISSMYSYTTVTGTGSAGTLSKDNETSSSGYKVSMPVTAGEVYKISGKQFNKTTIPAYLLRKDGEVVFYEFLDVDEYFSNYEVGIPSGVDELIVNLNSAAGVANALKKASQITISDIINTITKTNQNETAIAAINNIIPSIQEEADETQNTVKSEMLSSISGSTPTTPTSSEGILKSDNTVVSGTGYKASKTVAEGDVYLISGRQFNAYDLPAYILRANGAIVRVGWIEVGYFSQYPLYIPSGVDELVVNLNSSAGVANAIRTATRIQTADVQHTIDATESKENLVDFSRLQLGKAWNFSDNEERALLIVPVKNSQKYYIEMPASQKITRAIVIEKNWEYGDNLTSTTITQGNSTVITTTANTKLLFVQFEASTAFIASDFTNYNAIIKQGAYKDVLSCIDSFARKAQDNVFGTMYDLIESGRTGINRVGGVMVRNTVPAPKMLKHQQEAWGSTYYYDVDSCEKQYEVVNSPNVVTEDYIINSLPQEEIDFTPSDDGYTRIIMGKNRDDVFFISYVASSRKGHFGDADYDAVEITSDFVDFTRIIKGDGVSGDGIEVTGKTFLKVQAVKQFADGSYVVPLRCHDIASDSDGTYFYKLSADMQTLTMCEYENLNGDIVPMVDEFNGQLYDWHIDIYGTKCICTTYGSRQPETDYGRVWYTEDNGNTWKQVFQMTNHYQDGVSGETITQTHMHGVMLDPYSDRMFIIAGEDNRNIFWSDKGMETTDTDWNVIAIRKQTLYQIRGYSQVVGGYAFKDTLVFGSDNSGLGTIDRINKLDGGVYSDIEPAHEFLPNAFKGTNYCQGEVFRRDMQTPLLFCMTRENAAETEAENEELNYKHRGRVVASYDGFKWTEIWRDDTYGSHDVNIDGQNVTRNYSYCTRGMNCYLLKNGDAIIKYAGRDFYYFGGVPLYSVQGYANGSCKIRYIHELEKYLK